MKRDPQELIDAVRLAMPGWSVVAPLTSFTWAPDRHLRTSLSNGPIVRDVILRQSWRETSHEAELLLYREVLPQMPFRSARLHAAFRLDSDGSLWMVLEDIGVVTAQSGNAADRQSLLAALGQLHGRGILLPRDNQFCGSPLPRFDGQHLPFGLNMVRPSCWQELLAKAVTLGTYGLGEWVFAMPQSLLAELAQHPMTLLHGDTDWSNAVLVDGGVGLVDFERAMFGPPALDIGRVAEYIQSAHEMESYRTAFSETANQPLGFDTLTRWTKAGEAYNCLRWMCYYIEATLQGRDLGEARHRTYEPLRMRLEQLHASGWPACRE